MQMRCERDLEILRLNLRGSRAPYDAGSEVDEIGGAVGDNGDRWSGTLGIGVGSSGSEQDHLRREHQHGLVGPVSDRPLSIALDEGRSGTCPTSPARLSTCALPARPDSAESRKSKIPATTASSTRSSARPR